MNTVYCNADIPDDLRRRRLFDGQLYVYSASKSTYALGKFAREMAEEAVAPHDPRDAQHYLPLDKYVATRVLRSSATVRAARFSASSRARTLE